MTAESVPAEVVARFLNLTDRRVRQLVREGVIPKAAHGKYELEGCVFHYVRYLQKRLEDGGAHVTSEKERLDRVRADEIEIRLQRERREIVDAGDVAEVWIEIAAEIKQRLLSLPTALAPLVTGTTRVQQSEEILREGVDDALASLRGGCEKVIARFDPTGAVNGERVGAEIPEVESGVER